MGGSERAEEGDRISPLKGNGQGLEQKYCLSAVLGDKCDPSAIIIIVAVAPGSTMLNASASGRDADFPGSRGSGVSGT